jgi:hypothetical protein
LYYTSVSFPAAKNSSESSGGSEKSVNSTAVSGQDCVQEETRVVTAPTRSWDRWNGVFAEMRQRGAKGTYEQIGGGDDLFRRPSRS